MAETQQRKGFFKQIEEYNWGGLIVGLIIILALVQLFAMILGNWWAEAGKVKLGAGFMMMAVGLAVFGALGVLNMLYTRNKDPGKAYSKVDFLMWFMMTALAVFLLLFLPDLVPSIFADGAHKTAALIGIK